jgi:hypothetical protein
LATVVALEAHLAAPLDLLAERQVLCQQGRRAATCPAWLLLRVASTDVRLHSTGLSDQGVWARSWQSGHKTRVLASASFYRTRPGIQDAWIRRGDGPPARSHLITICSMIKVGSVISSRATRAAPNDSLTTYLRSSRGSAPRSPRSPGRPQDIERTPMIMCGCCRED